LERRGRKKRGSGKMAQRKDEKNASMNLEEEM
jgi:hypothetical protein